MTNGFNEHPTFSEIPREFAKTFINPEYIEELMLAQMKYVGPAAQNFEIYRNLHILIGVSKFYGVNFPA